MDAAKAAWDLAKLDAKQAGRSGAPDAETEATAREAEQYGSEPPGSRRRAAPPAIPLLVCFRRYVSMSAHEAISWRCSGSTRTQFRRRTSRRTSDFTPYMIVKAPTMRSGKMRLLEAAELVVRNP